jgi:hypothetical protein
MTTRTNSQTGSPIYTPYIKTDDQRIKDTFMDELRSTLEWTDRGGPLLEALGAGNLKLRCWKAGDSDPFLFMFVSHQDHILIRLAHESNMPRGFPALHWPGRKIKFFGFRPKFENDKKAETPLELEVDGVGWFKKWSGYLGQLLTWICPTTGQPHWTTTSKNSADTLDQSKPFGMGFAEDCARLFRPFITTGLIEALDRSGAHVCAEMMSKMDQVHGAVVDNEGPLVTTMGEGCELDLVQKTQSGGPTGKGYVKYWGFEETIRFCTQNGLPISSAILATGGAAKAFVRLIQERRDYMDDESYEEILAQVRKEFPDELTFLEGNKTHQEISGSVLEGLVVHFVKGHPNTSSSDILKMMEAGETEVNKLKFPGYTGRTMGLREAKNKKLGLSEFLIFIQKWAERWCTTEEGAAYWIDFYTQAWLQMAEDKDPDNLVGAHIRHSDRVKLEWTPHKSEKRLQLKEDITKLIKEGGAEPVGPITLVVPFAKDPEFQRIKDQLADWVVVWQSGKKKGKGTSEKTMIGDAKSWIRFTALPPKINDKTTGPVFCLPATATEDWHQKKIDSGAFVREWMTPITGLDVLDSQIKEVFNGIAQAILVKQSQTNPLEVPLQESVNANIPTLKAKILELDQAGKKGLFIFTAPQAVGKSTLTETLEECGVKVVSADKIMGPVFKKELIIHCHQQCQLEALKYLMEEFHVIVDNTSMKRRDCSIYKEIADAVNAEIVPVLLAGELWFNTTPEKRLECIDALDTRSQIRGRKTGKVISRSVIEATIDNALKDFRAIIGKDVGPDTTEEEIYTWLTTYPLPKYKQNFVNERGTFMYRHPTLTETCLESLEGSRRKTIKTERVRCMIMRGIGEFHCSLLSPNETKQLKSIVPEDNTVPFKLDLTGYKNAYELVKTLLTPLDVQDQPKVLGIGSLSNDNGEQVFYQVIEWEWAQNLREQLGFEAKDFHITLAWTGADDIHQGSKGVETLVE